MGDDDADAHGVPIEESDGALMAAAATDPAAFGVIYDRHVTAILRYLHRRTDSSETAADLCAETFAEAFVHRRRFRDTGTSMRPWLYAIARHQLGHFLRRQQVSERYRRRLGIAPLALTDEQLDRIEDLVDAAPHRAEIRAALDQLPDSLASAVRLRVGQDLAYPDVATSLGCSEGAARVRVSRGLKQLADLLEAP
jgi:RNA polymerase sigma-70 factor (ECF subfamily)